ncbi:A-kinase anchor protein 12b isoform X2 [Garra rufa]|uniref:A-kinase anchor protein 12b isoform X2 n=1 Tax=Garra rufa TaxID=137080 RepID=UPI003CCEF3BF
MLGTITLTVGQTDSITQKEESPETIEVHQEEVAPQINGEKEDNSANADEITTTEEKAVEEKQEEANEVGFKKIFRFVGFKFTLKKDKNEKTEPVQLLTVKEAEGGEDATSEEKKEEPATEEDKSVEDKSLETAEKEQEQEQEQEATTEEVTDKAEEPTDQTVDEAPSETEKVSEEVTEKSAEEVGTTSEKEPGAEVPTESPTSPPSQETQSPFKRFFTQGIFSNLRKKASFKKPKDEEQVKEKSAEEDIKETEETEGVTEGAEEAKVEAEEAKVDSEKEPAEGEQVEKPSEKVETEAEATIETTPTETEEPQDVKVEAEATSEAETLTQTETAEAPGAETAAEAQTTDDSKPSDKPEVSEAVTTEAEILSSQEKSKAQGSPLKKLFTGAGLKKLSSKKQKSKKEVESKQTESSEQVAETIQISSESAEPQKHDSGPSSPEESGEHVVGEVTQAEVAQAEVAQAVETDGEPVISDSEKKKDGILPWSSFKKLVTPKKRVKRPSESEDEAPGDKPKSSTLSSTESAVFDEKTDEPKPSEEVPSESKEESQAESKAEPKAEKSEPVAEEPKRKMDTSVSWEALICVGSAKKRARKTSDSDEEPKIEEEVQQSGEEQAKTTESPLVSSGEADHENLASSPEPEEELVSTWESFKRLVTHRKKPKAEEKSDEASGPEHTTSDSEAPKEESSFSLRKLIPRRKKKSDGKQEQISSDVGSAEDDSDTPAVVPLSEYDNEASAEVAVEAEEVKQESAPVTQAKASAEDRSPSWISTTVENVEDETEGKQLSDIPEEGDTAATPKSTDNTIAEDIVEFTSEAVTALEQVEETEMVSAVSRVTASPITSGETTPVPGDSLEKTDVVLQEAVETISVTTSAMAVTMTKEQEEVVAVTTETLVVESAIKEEKTVLVAHEKTEATTVCTDLDASEIKMMEEEILTQKPSVESVTVVSQVLVTELAVEDKTQEPEKASVTEVEVYEAQIRGGKTELKENAVEEKAQFEEIKETPEAETVTDLQEVAAVKVALINAVQQEPEILEEPVVAEKSPQVEAAGLAEPTVEESICAQTVEVTEVAVAEGEKVQELEDVKEAKATVEVASVEGVAIAVTEEVMATLPEVPASQTAGSTEDPIPVVASTEEFAVIKETVCVVSSTTETTDSHSADLAHETVMENVPVVVPTGDHKIQVVVNDAEVVSTQVFVEEKLEVTTTKVNVVVEKVIENVKEETEVIQTSQVTEAEIIEKQSSVIVQEVIQNVVENLAETHAEQKISEKTTEEVESCTTSVDVKSEEAPAVSGMIEEKSSTEVVSEDKAPLETCPEMPKSSDNDEQTRIVTEKPMKTVNDAILITETVQVSITDQVQPQSEEVATVSVEDVHQETEVTKSEVELKQAEEEKVSGTTESEEGKSQVESHPKEVPTEVQEETQPSEVSEAIPEEKMTETSQDQIVAEQCQMAQEVQIETAQEFNVGVINVINADDVPVQVTETNMKEESSEGQESEDKRQKDLEEPQMEDSTQDTTNQGESRDPDCQKTDAKNVPAKLETATEKTANASAVEEVENEIEPVSTEVVTVS